MKIIIAMTAIMMTLILAGGKSMGRQIAERDALNTKLPKGCQILNLGYYGEISELSPRINPGASAEHCR